MSTILQLNFELLFCLTGIQCKSNKSLFYYENAYCKFPDDPIIFMHEALIIVAPTGTFFIDWLNLEIVLLVLGNKRLQQ